MRPGLGIISRMGARGMTEPTAKFSNEISIVAKATGVGDLADGLACFQKRPAFQQTRGVIQTNRVYEITAGGVSGRKELLKVAQRDSRLDRHVTRTEVRIGKVILDNIADTSE